jgi:hypothetical protein
VGWEELYLNNYQTWKAMEPPGTSSEYFKWGLTSRTCRGEYWLFVFLDWVFIGECLFQRKDEKTCFSLRM